MPNRPAPQGEPLEDLPGFKAVPGDDPLLEDLGEDPLGSSGQPESPGPSTTSDRPSPDRPEGAPSGRTSTTSSRTSSEQLSVAKELEPVIAGVAHIGGIGLNKVAQRRTRSQTRLWLMTESEASGIARPLARIAARRAPEEIVEGDAADLLQAGVAVVGYGMRNAAGIDDIDLARIARGEAPRGAAQSSPAPAAEPPEPGPSAPAGFDVYDDAPRTEPDPPTVLEQL